MEVFYFYTVQYGSHKPYMAIEDLNVASVTEELNSYFNFFIVVNIQNNIKFTILTIFKYTVE